MGHRLVGGRGWVKPVPSMTAWIPQIVEPSVLRAAEEIGDAVAVEVHRRRADVVAFNVLFDEQAHVLKEPLSIGAGGLAQEVGVGRIQQDVELAVAIPVHDADFAAATLAGDASTQVQRPRSEEHTSELQSL